MKCRVCSSDVLECVIHWIIVGEKIPIIIQIEYRIIFARVQIELKN